VLKNWQTLGRQFEAKLAWMWLIASMLLLIAAVFIPGVKSLNLLYIIVWYFGWQKKQTEYVKKRWGKDYIRSGKAGPFRCSAAWRGLASSSWLPSSLRR